MKLTITCGHGVTSIVEEVGRDDLHASTDLRLFIREVLLACPACKRDAEGYLEQPGP